MSAVEDLLLSVGLSLPRTVEDDPVLQRLLDCEAVSPYDRLNMWDMVLTMKSLLWRIHRLEDVQVIPASCRVKVSDEAFVSVSHVIAVEDSWRDDGWQTRIQLSVGGEILSKWSPSEVIAQLVTAYERMDSPDAAEILYPG